MTDLEIANATRTFDYAMWLDAFRSHTACMAARDVKTARIFKARMRELKDEIDAIEGGKGYAYR